MKQPAWITFILAALASAAIWALTPILTGHREPWDTEGQFYVAALSIAGFVVGAIAPRPRWAHFLGSFAGQLGYQLIFLRIGPLVLVGAGFLLVYCAIFALAAALAAGVREWVAKRFG